MGLATRAREEQEANEMLAAMYAGDLGGVRIALRRVAPWTRRLAEADEAQMVRQLRAVGDQIANQLAESNDLFELVEMWRRLIVSEERARSLLISEEVLGSDANAYAIPAKTGRQL